MASVGGWTVQATFGVFPVSLERGDMFRLSQDVSEDMAMKECGALLFD